MKKEAISIYASPTCAGSRRAPARLDPAKTQSKPAYERLISLGRHCQTAYQIRRFTGITTAFYFDWIGSPLEGLLTLLRQRFHGCFERSELIVAENGATVKDRLTGISYRHCFSRTPAGVTITPDLIAQEYDAQRAKMEFLASRTQRAARSEKVLFVRQDKLSLASAKELHQAVIQFSGHSRSDLLVVSPYRDVPLPSDLPEGLFFEWGASLPTGKENWKGVDAEWDRIFEKFVSKAVLHETPITRDPNSADEPLCQDQHSQTASFPSPRKSLAQATALIVPLPEPGHIVPTLRSAAWLAHCGCHVEYLVPAHMSSLLHGTSASINSFGTIPDSPEKQVTLSGQHIRKRLAMKAGHATIEGVLEQWLVECGAGRSYDLVLLDAKLASPPVLAKLQRFRRVVIFSTSLPNWNLTERYDQRFPRLIFCPQELEVPQFRDDNTSHWYVEPSLPPVENQGGGEMVSLLEQPTVLVSFGTQSVRDRMLEHKLNLVVQLASRRSDVRFLISGCIPEAANWRNKAPTNVTVHDGYLPQRDLLFGVSAIIHHGGLGTLKESVVAGVPMIVLPSGFDQPFNAMRVRHHGLGEALFAESQSCDNLENVLTKALEGRFRPGIFRMQGIFKEYEEVAPSRKIIHTLFL